MKRHSDMEIRESPPGTRLSRLVLRLEAGCTRGLALSNELKLCSGTMRCGFKEHPCVAVTPGGDDGMYDGWQCFVEDEQTKATRK